MNIKVLGRNVREVGEQSPHWRTSPTYGYLSGAHDIQIEAFLRSNDHLFQFLTEELTPIDGVAAVETSMVMRTEKFNYKWEGEALGSTTETATGDPGEYAARRRALEVAQDPGGAA